RRHDAVDAHHHPGAAAVGRVVDGEVTAEPVGPQIFEDQLELPRSSRSADEARLGERPEQFGEQSDDGDAHHEGLVSGRTEPYSMRPSSLRSSMWRAATSTAPTQASPRGCSTVVP